MMCRQRQQSGSDEAHHKLHNATLVRTMASRSVRQARQLPSLFSSAPPGRSSLRRVQWKPVHRASQGPPQ